MKALTDLRYVLGAMISSELSRCLLVLGALIASAPAWAADANPSGRALVIGNSAYTSLPPLPACQMSARLVAASLTRAGFQVTELSNPSNARTGTAIATLGDDAAATPGARNVIYVCGYVTPYADRLFLLPTEARLERPTDVLSQGIVARLLMSSVAGPGTAAGLVLMDVAPQSGADPQLSFASMLRPGDGSHAGMAAALLPATGAIGPSPLAAAFSDMLQSGNVELSKAVADLPTSISAARGQMLTSHAPDAPSWLAGGPVPQPVPVPAAAPPPPEAKPVPAAADVANLNPADRRRVQLALQRLGYYRGRVTGVFAADAVAAIRHFQQDSNAPVTGKLTSEQAAQLLGG